MHLLPVVTRCTEDTFVMQQGKLQRAVCSVTRCTRCTAAAAFVVAGDSLRLRLRLRLRLQLRLRLRLRLRVRVLLLMPRGRERDCSPVQPSTW